MPKKRKVETAHNLEHWRCDCGCGQVYVYLCDKNGEAFARFSLSEDLWIPHAEDCVRMCNGAESQGPPPRHLQ